MFKQFAIAASLAVASASAFAQQRPAFYVGADYGTITADGEHHRHGYGVYAGYHFNAHVAVEGGYHRLSKSEYSDQIDFDDGTTYRSTGRGNATQVDVSVIGTLPLREGFSVYGRLGVNRLETKGDWTTTFDGMTETESDSYSENRVLYGIGLSYALTPALAARFEVQKPHNEFTRVAIGASYRF